MRAWTILACVDIAYAYAGVLCVRVCAFSCWNPTFQLFVFFFALLVAAAVRMMSVSYRPSNSQALYLVTATVQQQSHTKLFFLLWRPRTAHQLVRACACCFLWERTHHLIKRGARMQLTGQGNAKPTHTCSGSQKLLCTFTTTEAVQPYPFNPDGLGKKNSENSRKILAKDVHLFLFVEARYAET